jgi:hypothetical protein
MQSDLEHLQEHWQVMGLEVDEREFSKDSFPGTAEIS